MTTPKPIIWHTPFCRSLRPMWTLAELGVDFNIEAYRWDDLKKSEFLSINPEGRIPVLRDGDVRMVESGAITQWLVDKYGQGRLTVPNGTPEHALYCQWFHLSEASFMLVGPQPLYQWMIAPNSEKKDSQRDAGINKIKAVLQIMEKQLSSQGQQEYLVTSDITGADIMVGYALFFIKNVQADYVSLSDFPHVLKYTERLLARPAAKAVFSKLNEVPTGSHSFQASRDLN